MDRDFEIYVHIPFCMKKCGYCAFLSAPSDPETRNSYIRALLHEIRLAAAQMNGEEQAVSVFFGGGTPPLLPAEQIAEIMGELKTSFRIRKDAEITIEANPGTLSAEKLNSYRECGINRLSMGLQSPEEEELKCLGRIHDYGQFLESFRAARAEGFDNINVDLMYAIPGQTAEGWRNNLNIVASLGPEHISAYGLMIEEGTQFHKLAEEDKLPLPDEEEEYRMYEDTAQVLSAFGYRQYEISNYALPGRECRHNTGYWTRRDYLGLGIGAASLFRGERFSNTSSIEEYLREAGDLEKIRRERVSLGRKDEIEEFMFLGLRMTEGISKREFRVKFGVSVETVYQTVLDRYISAGLLEDNGERIFLTRPGIHISNTVMADFLL